MDGLNVDVEWHKLMTKVMCLGAEGSDRTGVGTLSLFGQTLELLDVNSFPAVTTKRLAFKTMAAELECFLKGSTNAAEFEAAGCSIWNGNAHAWKGAKFRGDMGRVYGAQWRFWHGVTRAGNVYVVDQLRNVVEGIKTDPRSRRHMVTAWNPAELDDMCLPPCHYAFQFYVSPSSHYLDCMVHMRSVDLFLGLPFDIASYALLMHLVARETNKVPRRLVMTFGDTHIYLNHLEQVEEVLDRSPLHPPVLHLDETASLFNFTAAMATLLRYVSHASVPAKLNV
jgi:thymidylate synthase